MAAPTGSAYRTSLYGTGTDLTSTLTSDYQFQIGSFVFGGLGSIYSVIKVDGLFSRVVRAQETLKPLDTGSFSVSDYNGPKTVVFGLLIRSSAAGLQAAISALQSAWTSTEDCDQPLIYRLPTGQTYRVYGRPRRMEMDIKMWRKGAVAVNLEFYCSDPRNYENTRADYTASAMSPTRSLKPFTITFPFTFGVGPTTGVLTPVNTGNTGAPWIGKITGPVNSPMVTNGTQKLMLNIILEAGEYVILDSLNRDIWFNGDTSTSYYGKLARGSEWWDIPPNSAANTVTLQDDGTRSTPTSIGSFALQFRPSSI